MKVFPRRSLSSGATSDCPSREQRQRSEREVQHPHARACARFLRSSSRCVLYFSIQFHNRESGCRSSAFFDFFFFFFCLPSALRSAVSCRADSCLLAPALCPPTPALHRLKAPAAGSSWPLESRSSSMCAVPGEFVAHPPDDGHQSEVHQPAPRTEPAPSGIRRRTGSRG